MSFLSCLLVAALCMSTAAQQQQAPQRVGMQTFQLMDTLYIDGGRFLNFDGSLAAIEPKLLTLNLSSDFNPTPGPDPGPVLLPDPSSRPADAAPVVSHGFMWSNLVDRAWLFGGKPVQLDANVPRPLPNDVWRFVVDDTSSTDSNGGVNDEPQPQWTQISTSSNVTEQRPSRGAGCNVPDLQRGYYLGGMLETGSGRADYLHWLHVFDFQTETLSSLPVPDFVPVVNQSLVFVNTGTRSGILVALGGSVETEGVLSLATLSSVYIFDIGSQTWIEQTVTSANGTESIGAASETDPRGAIYNTVFPRRRMSACAVVGSAKDKTSHNIFVLGGQSESTALLETWVLSLPSAIWIPANWHDPSHTPRAENTCILINSRLVFMYGGCLLDSNVHEPCMSYADAPYSWDVSANYPLGYGYNTTGFLVPGFITDVIGGNTTGLSTRRSPIFSNFSVTSAPVLQELFTPPYGWYLYGPFFYEVLVSVVLPVLLLMPFPAAALPSIFLWSLDGCFRPLYKSLQGGGSPKRVWRPWAFSYTYLLFLNVATLCLMTLVIFLMWRSEQPDELVEHWSGGSVDSGTWTGTPFSSHFIRAPTLDRPPRGLLSFYYDKGSVGIFNAKNSTQRLGRTVYFVFTFLPAILSVLYGRLWKALDDDVKRIDMYYRLQKPRGAKGNRSLCLNYHAFWSPLAVVQAIRYRHWTVAVSSVGSLLGSTAIPVLGNYVFSWSVYSGASLDWPDIYSWQVALVDRDWTYRLVGVMGAAWLCSCALLFTLPRRATGLTRDIRGIAGILSLLPSESTTPQDLGLGLNDCDRTSLQMETLLCEATFRLYRPSDTRSVLRMEKPAIGQTASALTLTGRPVLRKKKFSVPQLQATPYFKNLVLLWSKLYGWMPNHGNFFPLWPEVFVVWLGAVFTLLVFGANITASLNKNGQNQEWNYTIPIDPVVYLIVGVFVQSIVDVIEHAIRALTPFRALQEGYQQPSILWTDYTSGIPFWEIWIAFRQGHYLLSLVMLSSVATTIFTIFLGSLQLSAAAYGSTSFDGDLAAATASTLLIAFLLGVHLAVGLQIVLPTCWGRKKGSAKMLPRPPSTFADIIPYVVYSPGLREDLNAVAKLDGKQEKIKELRHDGRRYGMGTFRRNGVHFGVERHYAIPGAVDIEGGI